MNCILIQLLGSGWFDIRCVWFCWSCGLALAAWPGDRVIHNWVIITIYERGGRSEWTPGVSVNTFLRSYHGVSVNTILVRFYHGPFQYHIDIKLAQAGKATVKKYKVILHSVTLVIQKEVILEGFYIYFIVLAIFWSLKSCLLWVCVTQHGREKYPTNPLVCNKTSDMCLACPGLSPGSYVNTEDLMGLKSSFWIT